MNEKALQEHLLKIAHAFEKIRCDLAATQAVLQVLIETHPNPELARQGVHDELERWIAAGLASAIGDGGVASFQKLQRFLADTRSQT
ncbi:MAG: hypothetical protein EOP35_05155 [Rubrivivax sp.]|nr:MAG: hypothetical protein EOP35_05155 [Rubrivivax sp.]